MLECFDGLEFVGRQLLYPRDGCRESLCCCGDAVGGSDQRNRYCMVFEAKRVGAAFAPGAFHDSANAMVVFEGWSDVPTVGGMEGPGLAMSGFQMDEDFGAWWGHWSGVE